MIFCQCFRPWKAFAPFHFRPLFFSLVAGMSPSPSPFPWSSSWARHFWLLELCVVCFPFLLWWFGAQIHKNAQRPLLPTSWDSSASLVDSQCSQAKPQHKVCLTFCVDIVKMPKYVSLASLR